MRSQGLVGSTTQGVSRRRGQLRHISNDTTTATITEVPTAITGTRDGLGPDIEEGVPDNALKSELFLRVDYKERNLLAERVRRVHQAKEMAQGLYGVSLHEWQAGIPWDLRRGQDVMCVVATGKGKTMITSIFAGLFKSAFILYISPLIALMESQVSVFSVFSVGGGLT